MIDLVQPAQDIIRSTWRIRAEGQTVVLFFADARTATRVSHDLMLIRGTYNYGVGPANDPAVG